jgi:flagellar biosynthesis/type III secretory pathway M-ring protein FliF/YscJ
MVKVGKYDNLEDYFKSFRVQGKNNIFMIQELILDWLRFVIIIGGYILLRPILVRFGARIQEKQLETEDKETSNEGVVKEEKLDAKAKDDLQWGAKARIRQRKINEGQIQDGEQSDSDEIDEFLE